MKIFANLYTKISTKQLVEQLCLAAWRITEICENEYQIKGQSVELVVEGSGEVLLFGELEISLAEIDAWVETLSELPVHFKIDIHADEARLVRRYQQ